MKVLCQHDGGKCSQCGEPLDELVKRRCRPGVKRKSRPAVAPCPHLGAATGDHALLACTTCKGNVRIKHAIHACELFGRCLPKLTGAAVATAELAEGCHGCVGCRREIEG